MSKELVVYKKTVTKLTEIASTLHIKTDKDMVTASEVLSSLNKVVDAIEVEKQKVLKPLNEARTAEIARWKPMLSICDPVIALLRRDISDFQTMKMQKLAEKEQKITESMISGDISFDKGSDKIGNLKKPVSQIVSDSGSLTFRTDKRVFVSDIKLIPAEYFILDEKKVLESLKKGVAVPGAKIVEVQVPINSR